MNARNVPKAPALVVLVVSVSLLLTGCASATVADEPSATPSVEAEVAEPEVTEEPVPAADYVVSRESVQAYIDMSPEQFAILPKVEQLKLVAYYMQGSDELGGLIEFAQNYAEVSGDWRDDLPAEISIDNDGQEVATVASYARRFIFALEGDERQKMLYAVLQDGTSSGGYAVLYNISEENPTTLPRIARTLAAAQTLTAPAVSDSTSVQNDEFGAYKQVTLQDGSALKIYFYEIPVDEGSFKIWITE